MMERQRPYLNNVRAWRLAATWNLAPEAAKRIRQELRDHIDGAMAELLEQGMNFVDAERQVLKELGDPLETARQFERLYLTRQDARRIKQLLMINLKEHLKRSLVLGFLIGLCVYLSGAAAEIGGFALGLLLFSALFFGAVPALLNHLRRRRTLTRKNSILGLLLWDLLGMIICSPLLAIYLPDFLPNSGAAAVDPAAAYDLLGPDLAFGLLYLLFLLPLGLFSFYQIRPKFRIIGKLLRTYRKFDCC